MKILKRKVVKSELNGNYTYKNVYDYNDQGNIIKKKEFRYYYGTNNASLRKVVHYKYNKEGKLELIEEEIAGVRGKFKTIKTIKVEFRENLKCIIYNVFRSDVLNMKKYHYYLDTDYTKPTSVYIEYFNNVKEPNYEIEYYHKYNENGDMKLYSERHREGWTKIKFSYKEDGTILKSFRSSNPANDRLLEIVKNTNDEEGNLVLRDIVVKANKQVIEHITVKNTYY